MRSTFDTSTIEFATASPVELALEFISMAAKIDEGDTPLYNDPVRPSESALVQQFDFKIAPVRTM